MKNISKRIMKSILVILLTVSLTAGGASHSFASPPPAASPGFSLSGISSAISGATSGLSGTVTSSISSATSSLAGAVGGAIGGAAGTAVSAGITAFGSTVASSAGSAVSTVLATSAAAGVDPSNVLGSVGNRLLAGGKTILNQAVGLKLTSLGGQAAAAVGKTINAGWAWLNKTVYGALGIGSCEDNGQLSDVICNIMENSKDLPGFITALAYLSGVIMAVSALFKLKDHVLNPSQTPLSDSVKRIVASGALFTLPLITGATQNLVLGTYNTQSEVTGYAGWAGGGMGLDGILVNLFADIYHPLMTLIFAFGYLAGLVLVFIGISRILKTAQDGPRGPTGIGTIMMFVVSGVLFSLSTIMGTFSSTLFGDNEVATFAVLHTSTGDGLVDGHILAVISTVLVFMTIVGYISFLRGFFILKEVSEGTGQASLMAAVTHIFGGAIAVNLGPMMNAVQNSLGLGNLGVMFY
jgi:hypothetical protein